MDDQWSSQPLLVAQTMVPTANLQEPELAPLRELLKSKDFARASTLALRFTTANPDHPSGWLLLSEAQRGLGDDASALVSARRVVELIPEVAGAHQLRALLAEKQQAYEEAKAAYLQALRLDPEDAATRCNLAAVFFVCGDTDAALRQLHLAIFLKPDFAAAHSRLGAVLTSLGRLSEGLEAHERALAINPNSAAAHDNLGLTLAKLERYQDAEQAYRRALALDRTFAAAHVNLSNVLLLRGATDEAETLLREVIRFKPNHLDAREKLLSLLGYSSSVSPVAFREESEGWQLVVLPDTERRAAREQRFHRAPIAGRKLRLGILSAEFGQHPVAYFLLGWLRAIDRSRFELYLYSTMDWGDDKGGAAFQTVADQWRSLVGLSDASAAQLVRADRLDILVETSGHTANNRLGLIARRVAPVQCHYIGYFATTGLSEMDYLIGDHVLIPPEHDDHFTERVWRLPRTRYLYQPLEPAPTPVWSPSSDGRIRLGSFNDLLKIRTASIALWARLLHALPEACLVLKDRRKNDQDNRERILVGLKHQGIESSRVEFRPFVKSWHDLMAMYNQIDIALDTVPFNSATMAFDALWMGTPLVTLRGDRLAGRQAASCLTGLGRTEWIADDADGYVEKVIALVRDANQRRQIRQTQREQMCNSELCDSTGMAKVLEQSFDAMFARWLRPGTPVSKSADADACAKMIRKPAA